MARIQNTQMARAAQGQMIVSTTKITGKGQMGLLSALRASRGGN